MNRTRAGFTLVEIMIVVAIIALLAAIAIPNVLRGRTTANETSSIGNLRALVSSLEMFRSVNSAYPQTGTWVAQMYPAAPQPAYAPPSFNVPMAGGAASTVQGYAYIYTGLPIGCTNALGNCTQYTVTSTAQALGGTGVRSFVADETGVERHCNATVVGQLADRSGVGQSNSIDNPPGEGVAGVTTCD